MINSTYIYSFFIFLFCKFSLITFPRESNAIDINSGKSINEASFRDPLITSLDGNTVELAVEQLQFAENSMRYQSTLSFLSGKINTLMSAIKGE